MTAPVLTRQDLLAAGYIPEGQDRRELLRVLAAEVEDFPALLVRRLVRQWADPSLTPADRDAAWEALTSATALLDGCRSGAVEWRHVVPGANPNSAATVGLETLEQDITDALDLLLGPCPNATCDGDLHYTGQRHPDTGEDIEAGPCRRRMPDGVDFFGLSL